MIDSVQQPYCTITFEVLSSMISELMLNHYGQSANNELFECDWSSPGGTTCVQRFGSQVALHNVVNQKTDAVIEEFRLLCLGEQVFSWEERRWPHLQQSGAHPLSGTSVQIPVVCSDDLFQFHQRANTQWLKRFVKRYKVAPNQGLIVRQIDEVSVVAQPDRLQIS